MFNDPPILSVYKSENGFVLKVMVPAKKSDKDYVIDNGMEPKFFTFPDKDTLISVLTKSLPASKAADPEKEMAAAFKEAVKDD